MLCSLQLKKQMETPKVYTDNKSELESLKLSSPFPKSTLHPLFKRRTRLKRSSQKLTVQDESRSLM